VVRWIIAVSLQTCGRLLDDDIEQVTRNTDAANETGHVDGCSEPGKVVAYVRVTWTDNYMYIYTCVHLAFIRHLNFGFAECQHDPILVDRPVASLLSAVTICT